MLTRHVNTLSGDHWQLRYRPQRPLVLPDQALEQAPQRPLGDRLAAGGVLEGEDLLLEVGGEQEEVHQLGEPGAGQAVVAGDVGLVGVAVGVDLVGDAVDEREAAGDGGRVALGAVATTTPPTPMRLSRSSAPSSSTSGRFARPRSRFGPNAAARC